MSTALKRYLLCLGSVCALMAAYCAVVPPMLETPARDPVANRTLGEEAQPIAWWHDLFPAGSWQNANPMLIQTEQGTLLFQTLEQLESEPPDKRGSLLRLRPLTLIVPLSGEAKSAALGDLTASSKVYHNSPLAVVVSPEGADIQFREAPDWTSGATPPVTGGLLRGPIQISGIDPRPLEAVNGSRVNWTIRTSNVRIEGRRVWTNNEVEISSGNSSAIGKDLSIFLKQDLLSPGADDNGPWGLLDRLELVAVKQVNVALPEGGLWKNMKLGSPAIAAAHAQLAATLRLHCKGPFFFDFDRSLAQLSDHVRMEHRFENESTIDEFLCHELNAKFSVLDDGKLPDAKAIMVGPMQLDIIDAVGIDSAGPLPTQSRVQIIAPNIETELAAKRLQVQLDKRRFVIDSRNGRSSEGPPASPDIISLRYMGNVFHAPSLEYAAAPLDEHLGWLFASGPGDVQTSGASALGSVTARWQKSLKLQPSDQSQLVTLQGRALLEAEQRGHLASELINITLVLPPSAAPQSTTSAASPPGGAATSSAPSMADMASAYQVERVDATGEVILGNPTQNVRVNQLHLKFIYPEAQTAAASAASPNLVMSDAAGRPMHQWVGPPAREPSAQALAPLNQVASTPLPVAIPRTTPPIGLPLSLQPATPPKSVGMLASDSTSSTPILILGKELHSQIIVTSEKSWIDNLQITGPVVISPDGPPQPDVPTWRVESGQLQMASDASDKFDMQIVGMPARITFGEGWIEGPIIRLNQRTGHVWMDQPGAFCVPGNLMSSSVPGQNSIQWLEPIKCRWQGRMLFNGTTANIEGKITIDGYARTAPDRLLFLGGTCESMQIRLTEPVNIGRPGKTAATVHNLTLRENVDIRTAQTDANKRRISLEQLTVPELTYEVAANRVIGNGPGSIHSQYYSSGGFGSSAGGSTTPSASQPALAKPVSLNQAKAMQGMHLRFRDTMEARLTDKQLTFAGKVEVGMGPVQTLDEFIELNSMRNLKLDQSLLSGDLLRIYDASDVTRAPSATLAEGAWEFEAMGNVNFEGKNETGELAGKAARMTYFQAKDLLIIRGDMRIPAELRLKPEASSSAELMVLSIWSGSFNTKTFQPGPTGQGGEGELQLAGTQVIPRGQALPNGNWKSGNLAPATPAPAPPRPRDGLQDWFKKGS